MKIKHIPQNTHVMFKPPGTEREYLFLLRSVNHEKPFGLCTEDGRLDYIFTGEEEAEPVKITKTEPLMAILEQPDRIVHYDMETGKWSFWNESWSALTGSYDTELEAKEALVKYVGPQNEEGKNTSSDS